MNRLNKLAFAVVAVAGVSGCASAPVADLSGTAAAPVQAVQVAEKKVIRPLPSYGNMGGYRYRRFAAVAAAS